MSGQLWMPGSYIDNFQSILPLYRIMHANSGKGKVRVIVQIILSPTVFIWALCDIRFRRYGDRSLTFGGNLDKLRCLFFLLYPPVFILLELSQFVFNCGCLLPFVMFYCIYLPELDILFFPLAYWPYRPYHHAACSYLTLPIFTAARSTGWQMNITWVCFVPVPGNFYDVPFEVPPAWVTLS